MIGYVYKWVHEANPDEVLYVGSTMNLIERFNQHMLQFKKTSPSNPPLHKYISQHNLADGMHMVVVKTVKKWNRPMRFHERLWQDILKPRFGIKAIRMSC